MSTNTEFWQQGQVEGVPLLLQPVAHALLQAQAETNNLLESFPENLIWDKPGGVASIGFQLQHMTGVLDRLFTYANNQPLNESQLKWLSDEGIKNDNISLSLLINQFSDKVKSSINILKGFESDHLLDARGIGRKQIPTNVLGLLFHAAEHIQRHFGQLMVTAKWLSSNAQP